MDTESLRGLRAARTVCAGAIVGGLLVACSAAPLQPQPAGEPQAPAVDDLALLYAPTALDTFVLAPAAAAAPAADADPDDVIRSAGTTSPTASRSGRGQFTPDPARAAALHAQVADKTAQADALSRQMAPLQAQLEQRKRDLQGIQAQAANHADQATRLNTAAAQLDAAPASRYDAGSDLHRVASDLRSAGRGVSSLRTRVAATLTSDAAAQMDAAFGSLGIDVAALANGLNAGADRLDAAGRAGSASLIRDEANRARAAAADWRRQRQSVLDRTAPARATYNDLNDFIGRKQGEVRYWQAQLDKHTAELKEARTHWNWFVLIEVPQLGIDQAQGAIDLANGEMLAHSIAGLQATVTVVVANAVMSIFDGQANALDSYAAQLDNTASAVERSASNRDQASAMRQAAATEGAAANQSSGPISTTSAEVRRIASQVDALQAKRQDLVNQAADLNVQAQCAVQSCVRHTGSDATLG